MSIELERRIAGGLALITTVAAWLAFAAGIAA